MALAKLSPTETAEAGFAATIRHPKTNLPTGETITVRGMDSETFINIQRKQLNRRMERAQRSRNNKVNISAEESESEGLDVLVACTKSWATGDRPEIEFNEGEWLPCTPENVRRVYEALPWLKEQVDQEIGDRSNFLQA